VIKAYHNLDYMPSKEFPFGLEVYEEDGDTLFYGFESIEKLNRMKDIINSLQTDNWEDIEFLIYSNEDIQDIFLFLKKFKKEICVTLVIETDGISWNRAFTVNDFIRAWKKTNYELQDIVNDTIFFSFNNENYSFEISEFSFSRDLSL